MKQAQAPAPGRRSRLGSIVFAAAAGFTVLSGAAITGSAAQAASAAPAAPQARPAVSHILSDPCPCTLPQCKTVCGQN